MEQYVNIRVDWGVDFDHFHCPRSVAQRLAKKAKKEETTSAQVLIDAKFGNTWDELMAEIWS